MSAKAISDLDFALMCLKQLEPAKPNFQVIADALGCDKMTLYHRHYRLMKKTPDIGSPLGGSAPGVEYFAMGGSYPVTPKKRGRKPKVDVTGVDGEVIASGYAAASPSTATGASAGFKFDNAEDEAAFEATKAAAIKKAKGVVANAKARSKARADANGNGKGKAKARAVDDEDEEMTYEKAAIINTEGYESD